jgi:hypothetical protein
LVVLLELAVDTARPYPRMDEDSGHHDPDPNNFESLFEY